MIPAIIGILVGFVAIVSANILGKSHKPIMYGLILTAIGFLYVGYTWSNVTELAVTIVQSVVFLMLSYYGITKNINILAIGYFLHGVWDLFYTYLSSSQLIPPHYDIFCLMADVTIGAYIVFFKSRLAVTA